jgi:membrane protein
MAILLMTNGVNAILGGFENSQHITLKRAFFRQYFVSLGMSSLLSLLLIITDVGSPFILYLLIKF